MKTRQFAQLSYTSAAATFYVSGTEYDDLNVPEGQPTTRWLVAHSTHDGLGYITVKCRSLAHAVEYADKVIDEMVERIYYLRGLDTKEMAYVAHHTVG